MSPGATIISIDPDEPARAAPGSSMVMWTAVFSGSLSPNRMSARPVIWIVRPATVTYIHRSMWADPAATVFSNAASIAVTSPEPEVDVGVGCVGEDAGPSAQAVPTIPATRTIANSLLMGGVSDDVEWRLNATNPAGLTIARTSGYRWGASRAPLEDLR